MASTVITRVATALLGLLGVLYIGARLLEGGAALGADLPGLVIGLAICVPFLLYGVLGAERFARLLPPLAFLVEDPQARPDPDTRED